MEQEIKDRIIQIASELFMRVGIRSVTMDDVSRELSMSKKTLYQYFDNKNSLVTAVVQNHLIMEREEFTGIAKNAENAIHELAGIAKCIRTHVMKMNPSTLYDLRKYHGQAWQGFEKFKHEFIRGNVEDNIKRGIEEGYYREEIDPEIISIMRMEQVESIFDQRLFPQSKYDFARVQLQLFNHFVYGLVTDKGRKLYEEFQKQEAEILSK